MMNWRLKSFRFVIWSYLIEKVPQDPTSWTCQGPSRCASPFQWWSFESDAGGVSLRVSCFVQRIASPGIGAFCWGGLLQGGNRMSWHLARCEPFMPIFLSHTCACSLTASSISFAMVNSIDWVVALLLLWSLVHSMMVGQLLIYRACAYRWWGAGCYAFFWSSVNGFPPGISIPLTTWSHLQQQENGRRKALRVEKLKCLILKGVDHVTACQRVMGYIELGSIKIGQTRNKCGRWWWLSGSSRSKLILAHCFAVEDAAGTAFKSLSLVK